MRIVSPPGVEVEGEGATVQSRTRPRLYWQLVSKHCSELVFELLELGYSFYSLWRLRTLVRREAVAFVYERYALFGWAATWLARRRAVPLVLEVNDATIVARSRPLSARRLASRIEGWVFRNATCLVTVSERFKALIVSHHGIDPANVIVLPNAIDAERFRTCSAAAERGMNAAFTIGMVAAFVSWHGVDFLLDTVQDFLKRTGSRLLLVGDGPERPVIEARIRRNDLWSHVELTGFVAPADVPAHLARMDICVIANSNAHGSLMKLCEYMAAGKALLAPRYAPVEEIITHKLNGWLFRPLDAASFLEGIESLRADPALRSRLGTTARATALSQHTWDHRVEKLERYLFVERRGSGAALLAQKGQASSDVSLARQSWRT